MRLAFDVARNLPPWLVPGWLAAAAKRWLLEQNVIWPGPQSSPGLRMADMTERVTPMLLVLLDPAAVSVDFCGCYCQSDCCIQKHRLNKLWASLL